MGSLLPGAGLMVLLASCSHTLRISEGVAITADGHVGAELGGSAGYFYDADYRGGLAISLRALALVTDEGVSGVIGLESAWHRHPRAHIGGCSEDSSCWVAKPRGRATQLGGFGGSGLGLDAGILRSYGRYTTWTEWNHDEPRYRAGWTYYAIGAEAGVVASWPEPIGPAHHWAALRVVQERDHVVIDAPDGMPVGLDALW